MIMIVAIIYIFLSDVKFYQQLNFTFRKCSTSLKISTPPFLLTTPTPKNSKIASSLFANIENFLAPPPPPLPPLAEREGGEDTVLVLILYLPLPITT